MSEFITAGRNDQIIHHFYQNGKSYAALAKQFGLSDSMVKKVIQRDKRENGDRLRCAKPVNPRGVDRKPLSKFHAMIGLQIDRLLSDSENKLSSSAFGQSLTPAMSSAKLHDVRTGVYDLTVSELQGIAAALGTTLDHITQGF